MLTQLADDLLARARASLYWNADTLALISQALAEAREQGRREERERCVRTARHIAIHEGSEHCESPGCPCNLVLADHIEQAIRKP